MKSIQGCVLYWVVGFMGWVSIASASTALTQVDLAGGDFEGTMAELQKMGWQFSEATLVDKEAGEGKQFVSFQGSGGYARLTGVGIKPNTGYRLRCLVRSDGQETFGVENENGKWLACYDRCNSGGIFNWKPFELAFRTGDQKTIWIRVGKRYGGNVEFDRLELLEDNSVKVGDISPVSNPLPEPNGPEQKRGFMVWSPNYLKLTYPGMYPQRSQIKDEITCCLSPGEYEPMTVALTALEDLKDVRVGLQGDLVSQQGKRISKDQVDLRVVYYYQRFITNGAPLEPGQSYEMRPSLLYSNRSLDIPAKRTQQYWLTVHTKADIVPDVYEGKILVNAKGKTPSVIGVKVRVLPIQLAEPDVTYGMYFRINEQAEGFSNEKWFRDAMMDMKAHGMNTATIYGYLMRRDEQGKEYIDLDNAVRTYLAVRQQLTIAREAGLGSAGTPLILLSDSGLSQEMVQTVMTEVKAKGWPELLFYVGDEPNEAREADCRKYTSLVHSVPGARTVTAGVGPDLLGDVYDVWIMYSNSQEKIREITAGAKKLGKSPWIYDCKRNGSVPVNERYFAGLFMWVTGLKGNMLWCYTEKHGGYIAAKDQIVNGDFKYYGDPRPYNYVMASPEGPVPCLGWEARREGVDDYRYLHTLELMVEKALMDSSAQRKVVAKEAQIFLQDVRKQAAPPPMPAYEDPVDYAYNLILHPGMTPEYFDSVRSRVVDFIARLQERTSK